MADTSTNLSTDLQKSWGWLAFAGAISVLVAVYIFAQYSGISAILLGVVAEVSLLGEGAGYLSFAYAVKRGEEVSVARHLRFPGVKSITPCEYLRY